MRLIHIQIKTAPDNPAVFSVWWVPQEQCWPARCSQSDFLGQDEVALMTFMTVHLCSAVIHSHQSNIGSIFKN